MMMLLPTVCFGQGDACTRPEEYTVDRRCYVTNQQKQERPFNAVVGLVGTDGKVFCTGTIVEYKKKLYVFTAAHCVDYDHNQQPDNTITVKLQDGRVFVANQVSVSDYFTQPEIDTDDEHRKEIMELLWDIRKRDWAIYSITKNDTTIPAVSATGQMKIDVHYLINPDYDALSVGYGSLKIMSDQEINDFKQRYIKFLDKIPLTNREKWDKLPDDLRRTFNNIEQYRTDQENAPDELMAELGFTQDGIRTIAPSVSLFLVTNKKYYHDIFMNPELKVSECALGSDGISKNCQTWGGDSGGGIFDRWGNLMGIHTEGSRVIGGKGHAAAADEELLLKPMPWGTNHIVDSINKSVNK